TTESHSFHGQSRKLALIFPLLHDLERGSRNDIATIRSARNITRLNHILSMDIGSETRAHFLSYYMIWQSLERGYSNDIIGTQHH
ncbi:5203_t:CDS:1, partial [Paraglomus occultum]